MAAQTFAQINALAFALPFNDLTNAIQCLCISAETNAQDTVYGDKEAPVEKHDAIALASLECLLCDCEDFAVCKWFADNDVAW